MSKRRIDRRAARRFDAAERWLDWVALPNLAKLERLHGRPGHSARQRDRLAAQTTTLIEQTAAEKRTAKLHQGGAA